MAVSVLGAVHINLVGLFGCLSVPRAETSFKFSASYPGGKFVNIAPAPVIQKQWNRPQTQTIQRVDAQGRTVQQVVRLMQVKFTDESSNL